MADETHEAREGGERSAPRRPLLYVTDDAEGGSVADSLRRVGYAVVEVSLASLAQRSASTRPDVVLIDVDVDTALDEIARVRRVPGALAIDFIYLGSGSGPIRSSEDAIAMEGSAFFRHPIDLAALLRRMEMLTGGPGSRLDARGSVPPMRLSSIPPDRGSTPSLPAPGFRTPGPPLPMSVPSLSDLVESPRSLATFGAVSNELQQLLAEAEQRADVMPHPDRDPPLPTPEEEIENVLPADVLASLDEPIDGDEDEDSEPRIATGAGHERDGTSQGKPTTAGGSKHTTTSGPRSSSTPHTYERRTGSDRPTRERTPIRRPGDEWPSQPPVPDLLASRASAAPTTTRLESAPGVEVLRIADSLRGDGRRSEVLAAPSRVEPASLVATDPVSPSEAPTRGMSEAPAQSASFGIVVGNAVDARRFLAEAIARRLSGALCFEYERVVRRLVVREGDLVTAASGDDQESLVCFLGARGDLPRDEVDRLAGRIPPYGRHAGAALVAHGWLGQDQLWTTLRAHAEWIATAILRLPGGTAQLENEPPGRLRSEPSVFGAATGAEIFVELVRRAVSAEEAIDVLGGDASRLADGPASSLLGECALPPAELELVSRGRGGTLGDLLGRSTDSEVAAVVHALALLGVLDVIPAVHRAPAPSSVTDAEAALLDEEAIRARVRARLELVDEGDYFSVLGVARDATSYEVRRAFIELRRAFEPSRILSPRLHDLEGDVRKIVIVLEEAYEVLRDNARRERYRRAIDARPM